ncbi:Prolyl tripeptidyl peptidase precursor [Pirellula sp. SH-Sr6A]|uniref:S9 family peptidase n=1 Tax=Pirellula sp. SH-Sr6A TaxID=1632865 RepID=UPI00078EB468|nr:DPP IV N-terminal domain-containing protein [Pirellula sp. SH-Sr6A]AMV31450.1 Prolyl tripeptidyl peptidase precursor [Pirellula sp. SH-Sr6A]
MFPFHRSIGIVALCVLAGVARFAPAQSESLAPWPPHAEYWLKQIYEQGVFRAANGTVDWLPDSSGFVLRERDVASNEIVSWLVDARTGERTRWNERDKPLPNQDRMVSPDGSKRLVTRDKKILRTDELGQNEVLLVEGTADRDIRYRDVSWNRDGSRVLFVEADASEVRQRAVLVPSDPSYPGVQRNRFARVGGVIEKLRVGVVNADGSELKWLKIDSPAEGFYLGQVEWTPGDDAILVEQFSRFRDKRTFYLGNSRGDAIAIYSESSETWVESSQGKNSGLVWLEDGHSFLVITESDGWRHAYHFRRNGERVACLTPGDYDIIERGAVDEEGGWYYFYASPHDATQKHLYRVPLDGSGKLELISPASQIGTHSYQFSPDCKLAVHTFSSLNTAPRVELVEMAGHRTIQVLEENQKLREKLDAFVDSPTEFLKLDIGNGIEFDAWMIKPPGFDPARKYPVFIYVYGEPHAQTVLNEWGAGQIDFNRVASLMGYLVVSIDNRGTPAPKGAAWRRSIFGSLGPLSTEEQEAGLKALAKQCPYVDLSRVGIWGWSGGGSNTLNALFRKPDTYHVGIAVVPKPQPHLYNAWFQEIFMRTPEVNPDGYQTAAAIHFAEGLKGKLLIITGSGETNTHIQIIEDLVDRLVAMGKLFDYMVYPNRDHGLREGDGTLVHVRMTILKYLIANLPAGPSDK